MTPTAPTAPTDDAGENRAGESGIRSWSTEWRSRGDVAVLAIAVAAFWLVAGLPGAAAGIVLAAGWFVLPNPVVFVAGVVATAALAPDDVSPVVAGLPVVVLAGLLVTTGITDDRARDVGTTFAVGLGLVGLVLAVFVVTDALWLAGLVLVAAGVGGFISLAVFALNQSESTGIG